MGVGAQDELISPPETRRRLASLVNAMNRTLLSLALLASIAPAPALGCEEAKNPQSWWAPLEPKEVTVDQVVKWTQAKAAVPVDANGAETRTREGVIPGATLLSSSSQYTLSELPADKSARLVFYCANTRCGASHQAALRAIAAGYSDVSVLPAGIKGWKSAGQATSKPGSNT